MNNEYEQKSFEKVYRFIDLRNLSFNDYRLTVFLAIFTIHFVKNQQISAFYLYNQSIFAKCTEIFIET